jgi:hypothetical protein
MTLTAIGAKLSAVIAGLDPAIHRLGIEFFFRWMRGSSPRIHRGQLLLI